MQWLRVAGIVVGLLGVAGAWLLRFRLRRLRNVDWLVGSALSSALVLLGLFPDVANSLLAVFSFERGGGGRLIGLLVFANLIAFLLIYSALARNNRLEHVVDSLVRALAKKEFRQGGRAQEAPICVIIPAYNEAETIGPVLDRIPEVVLDLRTRTLVVVDGSTDETASIVRSLNQEAVTCVINRGGGSALKAGYELAVEEGAEIIVTLDADGQHMPEEIPALVKPILDGDADLVNGSRVLGSYEKDSQVRAAGVVFFNWLVSALTMTRITDCSNSFRAIRASALARLDLRQSQFHASELLIDAIKKGVRFTEVPITVKRRAHGTSKKPPSLRYGWGFMKAIVLTWLR
jgi:cellulose synthase/poly-beta-1,6-N-acetylglucosamine synthase-like glycosyltransferase